MKIGEVAKLADVSVDTVRFYERRRLLPAARRSQAGYRLFAPTTVARIQLVKRLQDLGLHLQEIADLLSEDAAAPRPSCPSARSKLAVVLARIDAEIETLANTRARIVASIHACDTGACALDPAPAADV